MTDRDGNAIDRLRSPWGPWVNAFQAVLNQLLLEKLLACCSANELGGVRAFGSPIHRYVSTSSLEIMSSMSTMSLQYLITKYISTLTFLLTKVFSQTKKP